ncbi:MAG: response regulator [Candidatus Omnitrophica bacterium]|nr:response regulator [Candidatus Omnitrophota bacterium]
MVKILLADDNLEFCKEIEENLKGEGYEFIIVNSTSEALEKVKWEKPQIVLLDIVMSEMDGLKTLEKIKQSNQDSIVIIISAVKDSELSQKAIKAGAVSFIEKPVNFELLKRSLRVWAKQASIMHKGQADILAFEQDEKKISLVLDFLEKKKYKVKIVRDMSEGSKIEPDHFSVVVIRFDMIGEENIGIIEKYKEAFPGLPILVILKQGVNDELLNKIDEYGNCMFVQSHVDTYNLISIIYEMVLSFDGKRGVKEAALFGDYVLIVDDDADICEYSARYLSKEGYKVVVITKAKDVLNQIKTLKPSVVIMDIVMPDTDGIELLKEIKKLDSGISVIMMTGLKDDSVCREALESGASSYLVKPFSLDQLKAMVLTNIIKSNRK